MERTINIDRILLIAVIVAAVCAFIMLRSCNVSPYPAMAERSVTRTVEPVDIPISLPPTTVKTDSIQTKIVWKTREVPVLVTDSAEVLRLISERDSLRQLLAAKGVVVTFGIDTVHAVTHDTVHVLCNEISRSIEFGYNPAPRTVTVERETVTITEVRRWGLGGTFGTTFFEDGQLKIRLNAAIGLTYIIF